MNRFTKLLAVAGLSTFLSAAGVAQRADEGKTENYDPVRLHLVEGDENWRKWIDRGVLYDPADTPPDRLCARGAMFVEDAGQQWLLYEAGPKNGARIALLKLDTVAKASIPKAGPK